MYVSVVHLRLCPHRASPLSVLDSASQQYVFVVTKLSFDQLHAHSALICVICQRESRLA